MKAEEKLVEANHLTKVFSIGRGLFGRRDLVAVDDVSFQMLTEKPSILTLIGESGSGKTTTARMVLGFLRPTFGEILYKGKDLWRMNGEEWNTYRREVQAIFQDPYGTFNPLHKVDRVLKIPLKRFGLANSDSEAEEMMAKDLEIAGLRPGDVLGKYPHQLSGGQRQRVMLARAFMLRPKLIIADEPVSMIDASLRASLLNIMLDMKSTGGISFLYITHDLSTASYITDLMAVMYLGSIVEMGPGEKIMEEPLHPYLKMLIDSIPIPDPELRWEERIKLPKAEAARARLVGCKFHSRCLEKTESCAKGKPKLIDAGGGHHVSCIQYAEGQMKEASRVRKKARTESTH